MKTSSLRQAANPGDYQLIEYYQRVRAETERLCEPLEPDDFNIQTMADVSPVKWHIAHVSWFFETFLLTPYLKAYQPFHPQFKHIFNSYYEMVGSFHPRPERGFLNRPTLAQVWSYRKYIDEAMQQLLSDDNHPQTEAIQMRTVVGLNHEQQHQELMLSDILHVFASNPLKPAYQNKTQTSLEAVQPMRWLERSSGVTEIGNSAEHFCYDNETPRHKTYIQDFRIADRAISNGEFIEFIEAGGYRQPRYWLSDGWKTVQQNQWNAPLYWHKEEGQWWQMSLNGYQPLDEHAPVAHVSLYEADAYARWTGRRLPTEAEWEVVASQYPIKGNFRESGNLQTVAGGTEDSPFYGDVWEWTQSAYAPYPGYKTPSGALGEYNGKFMASQFVLRGGSCFTPADHIRSSYRNFFYPKDQWQCSGFRLAEDHS